MAQQVDFVGDMDMVCCEETIGDDSSLLITSHSMLLSNFEDAWIAREWASSSQSEEKQDSDNTCSSPTNNKKQSWSEKEKQLFNDGLVLYGRKWTKIARFIGTRSVLQVRAFARKQSIKNQNAEKKSLRPDQSTEVIRLTNDVVDDVNVDVDDVDTNTDDEKFVKNVPEPVNEPHEDSLKENASINEKETIENEELVDICSDNAASENENVIQEEEENSLPENENSLPIQVPEREVFLDQKSVTEEEKRYHHEYFEGKLPKTPDRYMKIRNHILEMWEKVKPNYLNKTAVRLGLKNCGDVNCIGKIHEYLEMCGAINFGCEQACYNRTQTTTEVKTFRRKSVKSEVNSDCNLKQSTRLRKRRMFSDYRNVGSNYTIKHTADGEIIISDTNADSTTNKLARNVNPFKLIPCSRYENKPPFDIQLDLSAMIIMDLHAHLSHAEVIGLLGGRYNFEKHSLELHLAEPCLSESTGMQCEMDPVSQTEASVSIEEKGLSVVGWYHSHPTFAPNPSLRDLETQAKYQDWFSRRGSPFVALILTPYCGNAIVSKFRCMLVGQETIFGSYRKPFQLVLNVKENGFDLDSCLSDLDKMVKGIESNSAPIDPTALFSYEPQITYLEKMLQSIKEHMNNVGIEPSTMTNITQKIQNVLFKLSEKIL